MRQNMMKKIDENGSFLCRDKKIILKQIEKSQSLITVSVLVLNCTLALLLKPTQVACIEKKEGEGSRQRNKWKTNKNF